MKRLLVVAFGIAMVIAASVPASAREPVTFGDVKAQLEAVETGGGIIRSNNGFFTTIPPAGPFYNSIRPLAPFFDGLRYCDLDWHLVTIALFFDPEDLPSKEEVKTTLHATEVTFVIDGVETPATETTAVKTILGESGLPGQSFWRAWGIFFAPGALSIGSHTLTGFATTPDEPAMGFDQITFHIDPAGQGACL